MIEFSEYCKIYDHLMASPNDAGRIAYPAKHRQQSAVQMLCVCMAVADIRSDKLYIDTLIDQCGLETLRKLRAYFIDDTQTDARIMQRIRLLEKYPDQEAQCDGTAKTAEEPSFFQYLCTWINQKGYRSDAEFYNHAGMSRQRFSKLRNGPRSVSRETALHLAAALELDADECDEFLRYAGYSLNLNVRREQLIAYVMRNKKYTFDEMEELLYMFQEKTFLSDE